MMLLCCCWGMGAGVVGADAGEESHARNARLPDYAALHRLVADETVPMMWLFVGDSITHGCLHTHGGRSFAEHWMELVKWELRTPRGARRTNDIVINAGVSGETAGGFLTQAEWRLKQFRAQVVFINFGINDGSRRKALESFRGDLQKIVTMVREQGAIPVLQTPSLTLAGEAYRPDYAGVVREVAAAHGVLLVDHSAAWCDYAGYASASPQRAPQELMNDNLHPNALGHRLMAQTLARSLGISPPNSRTLTLPPRQAE